MTARLPNADRASVAPRKISHYLLSDTSKSGRGKAKFLKRFGFAADRPDELVAALLLHAQSHDVSGSRKTEHGMMYEIVGPLVCPAADCPKCKLPKVMTAWIIDEGLYDPRFVTLIPD